MNKIFQPTRLLHSLLLFEISSKGPLHGYALAASIEQKFGWKPSQTAIYNALKSLEAENAVTFEEKIENGRVQKTYSITQDGRLLNEQIMSKMQTQLLKKAELFFSFISVFNESGDSQETEEYKQIIRDTMVILRELPPLILPILKVVPKETYRIVSDSLSKLKQLAIENKIQVEKIEDPLEL